MVCCTLLCVHAVHQSSPAQPARLAAIGFAQPRLLLRPADPAVKSSHNKAALGGQLSGRLPHPAQATHPLLWRRRHLDQQRVHSVLQALPRAALLALLEHLQCSQTCQQAVYTRTVCVRQAGLQVKVTKAKAGRLAGRRRAPEQVRTQGDPMT